MSDAGPSATEPQEDTPLLHADASPTSSTHPRDEHNDHDIEETHRASNQQASPARVGKALRILFALVISVGITTAAFNIADMALSKYGYDRFGYSDYGVELYQWQFFWQVVIAIGLSIFNLIHLSQRQRPLPALVNILIFGVDGIFTFFPTCDAFSRSDSLFGGLCRADLDDPDPHWGRSWPGSLKECRRWEPTYQIITWLWLCFEIVTSLTMIAIAITCLVKVYKSRSARRSGESSTRPGNRWTIPAGQVNFEVSVYWGAPAPRGEGRPRQSETVEEGRQEA